MYRDSSGRLHFSPSDLMRFLESEFTSWMDRWQAERETQNLPDKYMKAPIGQGIPDVGAADMDPDDEEAKLLKRHGAEHESTFLKTMREKELQVVEIVRGSDAWEQTQKALGRGVDCVYQARLEAGDLSGFADFVVRREGKSALGSFHYEVLDTKLAKSAKPGYLIQLCAYTEMLEALQGIRAERVGVVLGTSEIEYFRTDGFWYQYQRLKTDFLDFQNRFDPCQLPHPGRFRSYGRWTGFAKRILEACDHPSRVANIKSGQIKKLEASGITTMSQLAETKLPSVRRIWDGVFSRLKQQAALQIASHRTQRPKFATLPVDPEMRRRGLALLPPASDGDVFFDMEGFPMIDGGLEYLFGAVVIDGGNPVFRDWWAHDAVQEKRAFEEFIGFVHDRWKRHPDLHVFHYAAYETTALKRLAPKHATGERKLDDLLRGNVFVDLYNVARQGLIVGTPSYSLKDVERLYMPPRGGEVTSAVGSIVAYQKWLDSGEPGKWQGSKILTEIRDYNRIDCESLQHLCGWLRRIQAESGIAYLPAPVDDGNAETSGEKIEKLLPPNAQLAEAMWHELEQGNVSDDRIADHKLLTGLLEFHWREARPVFWRRYERREMTHEELADDLDCLGNLERTAKPPTPLKRSMQYEYAYSPEQDTKLYVGAECLFSRDLTVETTIASLEPAKGRVDIKLGPKFGPPPARLSLIPNEYIRATTIDDSIYRYVDAWNHERNVSQAIDDLIGRSPPRIRGYAGGPLVVSGRELTPQVTALIAQMDETVLCVQGPPGTGKTYNAAAAIVDLLRQRKRVGVTANSHKAILNLMGAVATQVAECGFDPLLLKAGGDHKEALITSGRVKHVESRDVADALGSKSVLVGGTAWVFSRADLAGQFDYLFVDEAGQFSLANVVGSGLAAKNLVLVGDQMQLAQPILGTHPGECGLSALDYVLNGLPTVPDEFGVFLGETRRMHPRICEYISGAFYEGRLGAHPSTRLQRIEPTRGACFVSTEAGLVYLPVEHDGNAQASDEEGETIEQIVEELVGRTVHEGTGKAGRPLTLDDILFVAPFNMQVRRLQNRLGDGARVGSVDKFQGQDAHVVVVSMCSSSAEDSPRGVDFLLDPNRLNVAVSRAKTLSVVVASPKLVASRCQSVREMELVNLMCRLVDHAHRSG
jgi:predicted RecB family nuclease